MGACHDMREPRLAMKCTLVTSNKVLCSPRWGYLKQACSFYCFFLVATTAGRIPSHLNYLTYANSLHSRQMTSSKECGKRDTCHSCQATHKSFQSIATHWKSYAAHWETLFETIWEQNTCLHWKSIVCFFYIISVQTNNLLLIQVKYWPFLSTDCSSKTGTNMQVFNKS